MNVTYRKLAPADVKQYREVRLECLKKFPENFGASYEVEVAKPKLYFETNIEEQPKDKLMVGVFDNERLIGVCGFVQNAGLKEKHKGSFVQMYILPEYHGKGLGLRLLQTAIDEAFKIPEIQQVLLTVVSTNAPAIKIYEKAGFKEYGFHHRSLKLDDKYLDERLMILHRP